MLVSIITPVWNQWKITNRFFMLNTIHLGHYLAPTKEIGNFDIEFIIIDNGSTDQTKNELQLLWYRLGNKLKVITVTEN